MDHRLEVVFVGQILGGNALVGKNFSPVNTVKSVASAPLLFINDLSPHHYIRENPNQPQPTSNQ